MKSQSVTLHTNLGELKVYQSLIERGVADLRRSRYSARLYREQQRSTVQNLCFSPQADAWP